MEKIKIEKFAPPASEEGEHLKPVIDFLVEQGNLPHTKSMKFERGREGVGELHFFGPIDDEALKKRFEFPATIKVGYSKHYESTVVWDEANALLIRRAVR